ncbi:MAG: hypothetical protein KAH32_05465 [Chlamydiia bacterium]|nr:hypothetical protein [Chlamydiia bacterium]
MPFYILKSGEEVLIDKLDIPEPPAHIFNANPYLKTDPLFKKYISAQKARYYKGCYKSVREAKDLEEFKNKIGDLHQFLKDTNISWNEYLSNRGLPASKPKRKSGRPKLPDHLKKQKHRIKRSDQMKVLLAEKGIRVSPEGKLLMNGVSDTYRGWSFQPNGRIKFMGDEEFNIEPYSLSAHQFIENYC